MTHPPMQEAFFKKNGISDLSVTLNPMLPCENAPADSPEPVAKSSEPWMLKAGKEAHENEEVRPGEEKEVRTPSGQRMDRYNKEDAHIREIKPNNARGEKSGNAQLQRYKNEMDKATGRSHTTELTKYPPRQQ